MCVCVCLCAFVWLTVYGLSNVYSFIVLLLLGRHTMKWHFPLLFIHSHSFALTLSLSFHLNIVANFYPRRTTTYNAYTMVKHGMRALESTIDITLINFIISLWVQHTNEPAVSESIWIHVVRFSSFIAIFRSMLFYVSFFFFTEFNKISTFFSSLGCFVTVNVIFVSSQQFLLILKLFELIFKHNMAEQFHLLTNFPRCPEFSKWQTKYWHCAVDKQQTWRSSDWKWLVKCLPERELRWWKQRRGEWFDTQSVFPASWCITITWNERNKMTLMACNGIKKLHKINTANTRNSTLCLFTWPRAHPLFFFILPNLNRSVLNSCAPKKHRICFALFLFIIVNTNMCNIITANQRIGTHFIHIANEMNGTLFVSMRSGPFLFIHCVYT